MDHPAAQVVVAGADEAAPAAGALASPNADDSSDTSSPALQIVQDGAEWFYSNSSRKSSPCPESWRTSIVCHTSGPPTPTSALGSVDRTSAPAGSADGTSVAHAQGLLFTFVLALLTYGVGVMVAVLAESKDTISNWSTVPTVLYGITAVLAVASLAVGIMAAGCHAVVTVAGNSGNLRVSAFCAKLGAILSSVLLVVALCCKLGRWGCISGVPSGAVIAAIMVVVWIWGDAVRAATYCWRRIKDLCRRSPILTSFNSDVELAGGRDSIV